MIFQKWMIEAGVGLFLAVAVLLGLREIYHTGVEHGYEKAHAQYTAQALKDTAQARIKEQFLQTKLNEAQNARQKAESDLLRLAIDNRNTVGQLRQQLNAANSHLSGYSRGALVARIDTLSDVFEQCTDRYSELATKADGHAADVKLMQDAWPK